jgi:hypothetical protein
VQSCQHISEQYGKKELNKVRYYGWKIQEGEALGMDITRKQERILSQRQKESVTVGQAKYFMDGFFLQARYYGWTFWTGG